MSSLTISVYSKFLQAARMDLDIARILTKSGQIQHALYHLQQAYEKIALSPFIFFKKSGITILLNMMLMIV